MKAQKHDIGPSPGRNVPFLYVHAKITAVKTKGETQLTHPLTRKGNLWIWNGGNLCQGMAGLHLPSFCPFQSEGYQSLCAELWAEIFFVDFFWLEFCFKIIFDVISKPITHLSTTFCYNGATISWALRQGQENPVIEKLDFKRCCQIIQMNAINKQWYGSGGLYWLSCSPCFSGLLTDAILSPLLCFKSFAFIPR